MLKQHSLVLILIAVSATLCSAQENLKTHQPKLTLQQSGTTQLLISVSPVDSRVVWAGGTGGTYVVTTDGGDHWKAAVVPGAENDQFRDVHAVSDKIAYLMSIGNNTTDFKVYKTIDGGAHWTIQFTNENPNAFYDCFAFWTPDRGITHSDSANGVFPDIHHQRKHLGIHLRPHAACANRRSLVRGQRNLHCRRGKNKCLDRHGRRNHRQDPRHQRWRQYLECV